MIFHDNTKIGKFWNKKIIDDSVMNKKEVLKVINLNNKCLEKVSTGEWNQRDYREFSSLISVLFLNRINIIYPIVETFLNLPHDESIKELEKLLSKLNINNCDVEYFGKTLGKVVSVLQAKLLSVANIAITEEEKMLCDPIIEKIEIYKEIEKQINDDSSDYIKLLRSFYKDWVNEMFDNESLRQEVLKLEDEVIKTKRIRTRQKLSNIYNKIEQNKKRQINGYYFEKAAKYKIL